jgi:hypothetical protein
MKIETKHWVIKIVNATRKADAICHCWKEFKAAMYDLRSWHTTSCWCTRYKIKHWMVQTKIYKVWEWMKRRCDGVNWQNYKHYWWRWITYDVKWKDFENFYLDMWENYKEWLTLDREDNNWNYCKNNCRWTTQQRQLNNKRNNIMLTHNNKTQSQSDWCRELWINYYRTDTRIRRLWWSTKKALTK